jgi:hypothetical protein
MSPNQSNWINTLAESEEGDYRYPKYGGLSVKSTERGLA